MTRWFFQIVVVLALAGLALPASAERRVAWVVGNGDYPGADRLDAAAGDARMIARQLRDIGFEVTVSTNTAHRDFNRDLAEFTAAATGASVALFYYAGHGFEVAGENYLMPTDIGRSMAAMDRDSVRLRGVALGTVLRDIRAANPQSLIAVIDACRDAPTRGASTRGFVQTALGDGSFLAYSTRPGERAIDSAASLGHASRNSPFALYFAENLVQPGLTVLQLMEATQAQVDTLTQGRQRPWFASALKGPLVLNPPKPVAAATTASAPRLPGPFGGASCPPERVEASRLWNAEMREIELEASRLDTPGLAALRRRVDAGEARALTILGLAHDRGVMVAESPAEAVRYWKRAADAGNVIAQTLLGEAHVEGRGTPSDRQTGIRLLEKASHAGFPRATLDLVTLQDDGNAAVHQLMLAFCQGMQDFGQ